MTAAFSMKSSSSESVAAGKTLNGESFSLRRLKRYFSVSIRGLIDFCQSSLISGLGLWCSG